MGDAADDELDRAITYYDEYVPEADCPKCRQSQPDHDGFGVLKCIHCDYCSHPSADKDHHGLWRCGFCECLLTIEVG
jgi:hypothetical protein